MSVKQIAPLPLSVGQKVITLFSSYHFPSQVFHTEVVAIEKFGKRKVYILKCFNERLLKKAKTWDKVSDFDREETHTTEREDIYFTLAEAVSAQLRVYDNKISRMNEEKENFILQVLEGTTKKSTKS